MIGGTYVTLNHYNFKITCLLFLARAILQLIFVTRWIVKELRLANGGFFRIFEEVSHLVFVQTDVPHLKVAHLADESLTAVKTAPFPILILTQ